MTSRGSPAGGRISLASTLHDPADRVLAQFQPVGDMLRQYLSVSIACTDPTSHRLVAALQRVGVRTVRTPAGATGTSRRAALATATESSPEWILYCDFDRWIHWATHFPGELEQLPSLAGQLGSHPWYVCVGRSERAFGTHPEVQQIAESATNHALSLVLGHSVDAIAGAAWMNAEAAQLILRESVEPTAATDLEWPALVNRSYPGRVASIRTEGLEFETATFYKSEIAHAGGREAWIKATYDRPDVWADRLQLAADSVAALVRVGSKSGA